MTKWSLFLIVTTLCFGVTTRGFCESGKGADAVTSFIVQASLDEGQKNQWLKQNRLFVVDATVKYTGLHDAQITYWVAGQSSWITSNADLIPNHHVQQDGRDSFLLKSGQSHRWKVLVQDLRVSDGGKPVAFRLGFLPNGRKPLGSAPISSISATEIAQRGGITWSNELTYVPSQ